MHFIIKMELTPLFLLLLLTTLTLAKHYCFGEYVKCYCGGMMYNNHSCTHCSCDHYLYISTNKNNHLGSCDQSRGFHLGCGTLYPSSECA